MDEDHTYNNPIHSALDSIGKHHNHLANKASLHNLRLTMPKPHSLMALTPPQT